MSDIRSRGEVLAHVAATRIGRNLAEYRLLTLARDWAVLHAPESLPPAADTVEAARRRLDNEYGVQLGGEGTPEVLAYTPVELAAVLHDSVPAARRLIADALDLDHRLPRCRAQLKDGGVAVWHARRIATATRHLTAAQAEQVDQTVGAYLGRVPFGRLERILDAAVAVADPVGARSAELEAAARRFVGIGRGNDHHVRSLVARIDTLDAAMLMAMVNRVADLLGTEGDRDHVDVRRSRALGLLARPDLVLALLLRHTEQENDAVPAVARAEAGPMSEPESEPEPVGLERTLADREAATTLGRRASIPAPRVVLHLHLTDSALAGLDPSGVARVEGHGPVTAHTVRLWLTDHLRRHDLQVSVRPTTTPGDAVPADAYEIPARLRDAIRLRHPVEVYPHGTCPTEAADLDHTVPYRPPDRGGPPGQTAADNLGPLSRGHHRTKTQGRMQLRQPAPGVYLWRSRHGHVFLVTSAGTHDLGAGPLADRLWHATDPGPLAAAA